MKLTNEDLEMMERMFVTDRRLDEVLDKHGAKIKDGIMAELKPELHNINKRLDTGSEQFRILKKEIHKTNMECAKRAVNCPVINHNLDYMEEDNSLNDGSDSIENDPTTLTLRKVLVWVGILFSILLAGFGGVVGIIALVG